MKIILEIISVDNYHDIGTIYSEIFAPPVLLLPCSPSLSADKFKIGLIPMSQIIFYIKHNFVQGIQDRVKLHVLKDENCKRQNTVY